MFNTESLAFPWATQLAGNNNNQISSEQVNIKYKSGEQ